MVSTDEAILLELFGILLVVVAGVNELGGTHLFAAWSLVDVSALLLVSGLVVGGYGLYAGLRTRE